MLELSQMSFASDKPYPPINITEKNGTYARWILDNVGGCNSEISAVSLYFYNCLMTEKCHSDVSRIFHKISIVEMHHLQIFGKIALLLGENPRLWTQNCSRKAYWSPGCNKYPLAFSELMHNALQGELAAIEKYEKQTGCIGNACIVENLQRIILDEKIHVDIYRQIIEEYCL